MRLASTFEGVRLCTGIYTPELDEDEEADGDDAADEGPDAGFEAILMGIEGDIRRR